MAVALEGWAAEKSTAQGFYASGDFAGAVAAYSKALESLIAEDGCHMEAAKLYANRCMAHQRLGAFPLAVKDAQEACRLAEDWDKAWYRLGTAYLGLGGSNAEAQAAFSRGLQLKPHNKQLQEGLARCTAAAGGSGPQAAGAGSAENRAPPAAAADAKAGGKPAASSPQEAAPPTPESSDAGAAAASAAASAATSPARASSSSEPGGLEEPTRRLAEAQKALGNEAFKEGRYEEAVRCFAAAIQLSPSTAVYYGNRSAALLMSKKYKGAVQDSLRAVELDPAFAKGYARAGKGEMLQGNWERAEELYRRGIQLDPSQQQELVACQIVARKVQAGQEALAAGEAQRAFVLAEAACQGSLPPAEPAVRLKVEALVASGRHAEAVAEARNMTLGGDAYAPEVLALRSHALYLCGNMPMAQQLYQQALRRDPDCLPAQRGLKRLRAVAGGKDRGNTAFAAGSFQEAYDCYSASLAADPDLKTQFVAQVVCNRAAAAAKLGRHDDALADAELAIELDSSYAKAYVRRAQAHHELKNYDAAIRDYEKVAQMEEGYPGLGEMLRQSKLALKKSKRIDYYAVLEVESDAGEDAIKRAYRKAALKHHPDKAGEADREAAEAKFKLVGEANSVLSDPQQRQRYDAGWSLEEIQQGFSNDGGGGCGGMRGGGGGFGGDDADLFAHLFASRMGGGMGGMGGGGSRRGFGGGFGGGF